MKNFWKHAQNYGASEVFTKFSGHYKFEKRREKMMKKIPGRYVQKNVVDLKPIYVPPSIDPLLEEYKKVVE